MILSILGNCYGLKLPNCWLQFETIFTVSVITIFGTLSFPMSYSSLLISTEPELLLLLYPFNGLFSRTAWVSQHQKGRTSLDLNEARDDGFWDAVASAGPYANNLQTYNHTNISSLNLYMPGALHGTQLTVSKHWRHWTRYSRKIYTYSTIVSNELYIWLVVCEHGPA